MRGISAARKQGELASAVATKEATDEDSSDASPLRDNPCAKCHKGTFTDFRMGI
jgi:hypothetical protein